MAGLSGKRCNTDSIRPMEINSTPTITYQIVVVSISILWTFRIDKGERFSGRPQLDFLDRDGLNGTELDQESTAAAGFYRYCARWVQLTLESAQTVI